MLIHKTGRVGQVVSFRAKRPCWTYGWGRVKAEIEERYFVAALLWMTANCG